MNISNPYRFETAAGGYLSDDNPIKLGYTLRKIDSTYTGSVILAQRHSDDAELLIGYSGDAIDTGALLIFAGSATVGVKTLFEGSGKAINATQTDKTKQPLIVISGVLVTDGGLPSMDFGTLTTPKHLSFTTDLLGGKHLDLYWALSCRNYDSLGFIPFSTSNGSSYWQISNQGGFYVQSKGQPVINPTQFISDNVLKYMNMYCSASDVNCVLNGVDRNLVTATPATATGVKTYTIGKYLPGSSWDLDGKISEFIVYEELQINKEAIKANIKSYYGLT